MSFVFKNQIPRRTFLRGAGVTLALPLLLMPQIVWQAQVTLSHSTAADRCTSSRRWPDPAVSIACRRRVTPRWS